MLSRFVVSALALSFLCGDAFAQKRDQCLVNFDNQSLKREAELSAAAVEPPVVETTGENCGYYSSLLDTFETKSGSISVRVGTATFQFMPLALYDKNCPHKCNQIKVRTACMRQIPARGGTEIELYDKDRTSKGRARFVISQDGVAQGITAEGKPVLHREYALIRARFAKENIPARIRARINEFESRAASCKTRANRQLCTSSREAVAEATVLERLRAERFPRTIGAAEIASDWKVFNAGFANLAGISKPLSIGCCWSTSWVKNLPTSSRMRPRTPVH